MTSKHPKRCETCNRVNKKQNGWFCGFTGYEIFYKEIRIIERVGCASHSSASQPVPEYNGRHPHYLLLERAKKAAAKAEREKVLDELKWMRPQCFGNHDATCDTKCAWAVRQRCCESLRGGEQR